MSASVIRALAIALPVACLLLAVRLRRPPERRVAAAILATAWNLVVLVPINLGPWWSFQADGAVVGGLPVDLLLGWALLWGAVPALAAPRVPLPLTAAVLAWIDLALMPRFAPVVVLGDGWLTGEAIAVAAALIPGLLLARWTEQRRRLPARALLQIALAGALGVGTPVLATGVLDRPAWALALVAQALAAPMLLGLAAVREFAVSGGGTPLPYDPPRRLVTTGPYAYVRNPMQVAMTGGYLVLAVLDVWFLAAAAVSFSYGAGLAAWHEGEQLERRFGAEWTAYRRAVRAWVPRWRPAAAPAVIHVDAGCGQCRQVGGWITGHGPVALEVVAAEPGLRRITYLRHDGMREQGVAAFAQALSHLHLGWALAGWLLMLPGLRGFAQLCVDVFGPGRNSLATCPQEAVGPDRAR